MSRRFVALLRGINVGTAKRVSMTELRAVVESLGFRNAKTLLNSGNVVFTGEDARATDVGHEPGVRLIGHVADSIPGLEQMARRSRAPSRRSDHSKIWEISPDAALPHFL